MYATDTFARFVFGNSHIFEAAKIIASVPPTEFTVDGENFKPGVYNILNDFFAPCLYAGVTAAAGGVRDRKEGGRRGELRECKGLAHLDLSSNMIGDKRARMLAEVLREYTRLAHLVLSSNRVPDKCKDLVPLSLHDQRDL
eukprot:2002907-Rhodomonas_salina.7